VLLLLVLLSVLRPSAAASTPAGRAGELPSKEQYDCRPFGECEPCPKSQVRLVSCPSCRPRLVVRAAEAMPNGRPSAQRNEPFCQPYGNRRLLHCVPKGHAHHDITPAEGGELSNLHEKEIPAWEACGKVVLKERQDYWEFVVRPPTPHLLQKAVPLTSLSFHADGQRAVPDRRRDGHAPTRAQAGDAPVPAAGRADRPPRRRGRRRRPAEPFLQLFAVARITCCKFGVPISHLHRLVYSRRFRRLQRREACVEQRQDMRSLRVSVVQC
jgi:hypothetical protein